MRKAVIYGLGKRYRLYKDEIAEVFDIVALSDKNYERYNTIRLQDIDPLSYDVIVVPGNKYYIEICNELRGMGIDKEIIGYESYMVEKENKRIDDILEKYDITGVKERRKTSFSDMSDFPKFCLAASKDDEVFADFKRSVIFSGIIEHSNYEDGLKALDKIIGQEPRFTDEQWNDFLENDRYGNPRLYEYLMDEKKFKAGANTLIYISELQEIVRIFMDQYKRGKIRSVSEIGIGFGGLCRLILRYWKEVGTYNLIDLPEVLALADKYLGKYDLSNRIMIDGTSEFENVHSDLVVSNFAFSELNRDVQETYIDKVISTSNYGFMIWNPLSERELDGMTMREFMERVPNAERLKNDLFGDVADTVIWKR